MNIKFHGSEFRMARELVGLDPKDCFALATYKINHALAKQTQERLPYVFFVLSALGLTAESVAALIPEDYAWAQAILGGRSLEESVVEAMLSPQHSHDLRDARSQIEAAEFRVISATKTNKILTDKLYVRVYALRTRGFNRSYRNAEIDLHISLSGEMMPVEEFFQIAARESLQRLAIMLWNGDVLTLPLNWAESEEPQKVLEPGVCCRTFFWHSTLDPRLSTVLRPECQRVANHHQQASERQRPSQPLRRIVQADERAN
jgi:hypothetical protein